MRGRSLSRDAAHTLATHRGGLRERLLAIDPEFFSIPASQLPHLASIREEHERIRTAATALAARDTEGRLAATFSRAQFATLERLADAVWRFHLTLCEAQS